MEVRALIRKHSKGVRQLKFNQWQAKPVYLEFNNKGVKLFNTIYRALKESNLSPILRTESGSIKQGRKYNRNSWDIRGKGTLTLTVCLGIELHVFKLAGKIQAERKMSGGQAFKIFKQLCLDAGIDLDTYAIYDGKEVKKEIKDILIDQTVLDTELENVHHIDFHNSYPAGLANTHSEFKPLLERLFDMRKQQPELKEVLNYSIGYMQSKWIGYRWANLARDAINDNYKRLSELTIRLLINGRKVLGHNTDGIWYQGEVYHGEGEGDKLGEWSNDHINCKFRAKSSGAYEYIEDGKYHAVVRGVPNDLKDNWQWGDIYNNHPMIYVWDDEEGVVMYEDK